MTVDDQITVREAFEASHAIADVLMTAGACEEAGGTRLNALTIGWLGRQLTDLTDGLVVILRAADPNCGL